MTYNENTTDYSRKTEESLWVVSASLTDEQIQETAKDILSSPTVLLNYKTDPIEERPLYSLEQMLNMFRTGYLTLCNSALGKKILSKTKHSSIIPHKVMRRMHIGDKAHFPYEKWGAARTAATKIKQDFGSVFLVKKMGPDNGKGIIEVTRIK